mmetsp:Transcript_80116/g.226772  ORF Transcript_80116/g.226772 Transcript_80116/m.226772 type:complete len:346 (+) Transcript_80116:483-1520(+)
MTQATTTCSGTACTSRVRRLVVSRSSRSVTSARLGSGGWGPGTSCGASPSRIWPDAPGVLGMPAGQGAAGAPGAPGASGTPPAPRPSPPVPWLVLAESRQLRIMAALAAAALAHADMAAIVDARFARDCREPLSSSCIGTGPSQDIVGCSSSWTGTGAARECTGCASGHSWRRCGISLRGEWAWHCGDCLWAEEFSGMGAGVQVAQRNAAQGWGSCRGCGGNGCLPRSSEAARGGDGLPSGTCTGRLVIGGGRPRCGLLMWPRPGQPPPAAPPAVPPEATAGEPPAFGPSAGRAGNPGGCSPCCCGPADCGPGGCGPGSCGPGSCCPGGCGPGSSASGLRRGRLA